MYKWIVSLFGKVVPPWYPLAALPFDTDQFVVVGFVITAVFVESVACPAESVKLAVVELPAIEEGINPAIAL